MEHQFIPVEAVMKKDFDVIDRMLTVSEAIKTMRYKENKSLIVDKRDEKDEYGILLVSDIARKVLAKDRSPERVNVYEVMVKPAISVHPDMDIRYCARLFTQFGLSRAPVVNHTGQVVGIVSMTDLVIKGLCRHIAEG